VRQLNDIICAENSYSFCRKDSQRFMLDTEIYVDRIADMRVNDMNAVLEAVRQMALIMTSSRTSSSSR